MHADTLDPMRQGDDLLVPRQPIGRSFVPARSPLARRSECRGMAVLANWRTRAVVRLSPAGECLWACSDGTRSVGGLLDEAGADDPKSSLAALISIRRLRALGMLLEAGRADCPPPAGDPGDRASEGSLVVVGSVDDGTFVAGNGSDHVLVQVEEGSVRLASGEALRAMRPKAGGGDDLLAELVRAITDASWSLPGALDLAAGMVGHLEARS